MSCRGVQKGHWVCQVPWLGNLCLFPLNKNELDWDEFRGDQRKGIIAVLGFFLVITFVLNQRDFPPNEVSQEHPGEVQR